ncbi:MAG: hypothetical protein ACFE95_22340 [Candidatus Hodarchaeota archaeon]
MRKPRYCIELGVTRTSDFLKQTRYFFRIYRKNGNSWFQRTSEARKSSKQVKKDPESLKSSIKVK